MKLSKFIAGLTVLRPHYTGEDGYHLGAEHDVIYLYPTDTPLSRDEVAALLALGWMQENTERNDDGEMEVEHYDPTEGWRVFA